VGLGVGGIGISIPLWCDWDKGKKIDQVRKSKGFPFHYGAIFKLA